MEMMMTMMMTSHSLVIKVTVLHPVSLVPLLPVPVTGAGSKSIWPTLLLCACTGPTYLGRHVWTTEVNDFEFGHSKNIHMRLFAVGPSHSTNSVSAGTDRRLTFTVCST